MRNSIKGAHQPMEAVTRGGELIFRSVIPGEVDHGPGGGHPVSIGENRSVEVRAEAPGLPHDYETALVHLLDQVRARKVLEAKVAEDAPKVAAWEAFLDRDGWLQVGDIARALGWGRNTLFARLRDEGVLLRRPKNAPCAEWAKNGWACARPNGHVSQRGEEETTTLISVQGAARIARLLCRLQLGAA